MGDAEHLQMFQDTLEVDEKISECFFGSAY
jgi:hypothetical protein